MLLLLQYRFGSTVPLHLKYTLCLSMYLLFSYERYVYLLDSKFLSTDCSIEAVKPFTLRRHTRSSEKESAFAQVFLEKIK